MNLRRLHIFLFAMILFLFDIRIVVSFAKIADESNQVDMVYDAKSGKYIIKNVYNFEDVEELDLPKKPVKQKKHPKLEMDKKTQNLGDVIRANKDLSALFCGIDNEDFVLWNGINPGILEIAKQQRLIGVYHGSKVMDTLSKIKIFQGNSANFDIVPFYNRDAMLFEFANNRLHMIVLDKKNALKLINSHPTIFYRDMSIKSGCKAKNGEPIKTYGYQKMFKIYLEDADCFFKAIYKSNLCILI